MLVVLTELHRLGAGPNDFRRQRVAVDPETIHRLVPSGTIGNGRKTTLATLTDGATLTLVGSVEKLAGTINELYQLPGE
ncbi:hypothetical protein LCGC14_2486600 [marine sediment metagenome]|uniref:Uncharacterized protein n=1 Tax=marine sediment metagenome TaxID=412755 RepID=A0A0F9B5Y4_9ZZZZ